MKNKLAAFLILILFQSRNLAAQVQVSQEPLHPIVFQNKYIRVLDVVLQPKDTTQFHIHSLPSIFVYFTNTTVAAQTKGNPWTESRAEPGTVRYAAHYPDTLIHRVTNVDSVPFHVNDIEILSAYSLNKAKYRSLPFPIIFENEKAVGYRLSNRDLDNKMVIAHGPLIIELIEGEKVFINYGSGQPPKILGIGRFQYIEPGTTFSISTGSTAKIDLAIFEIK